MKRTAIIILILLLIAGFAEAISVINYQPTETRTVTSSRTINFWVMLNGPENSCNMEFILSNGTILGNFSTTQVGNTYNKTYIIPKDSDLGLYHNFTVFCNDTNTNNFSFIDTKMFKLRVTTPTAVLPLTGVNYASKTLTLSATVPVAINNPSYGCGYTLTLSNGTTIARKSMKSSNNLTWTNSTAFTTIIDSNFGLTHNLTFDCNDSTGSYSGEVQQFQVATSTPSIFWYNLSISAQQINLSVNSTTTPICTGIMFNASNVNVSSVTGTAIFGNATINSICNFAINSGQMGSEGLFNLQSLITDSLLNAPTAQLNSSMIYKILIAGWNPITYSGNTINSSTLCNQISGCTQISQINNTLGNYTTYSISTPSINNASSVLNGEGLLVYESTQTDFFENDMLSSATNNVSLTTGWNLIGLTQSTTVNTTLYASGNITQSSKFNILGSYQTCDKTVQICTGSVNNPAQITLPKGYAVWVLANANTSINRTVISG